MRPAIVLLSLLAVSVSSAPVPDIKGTLLERKGQIKSGGCTHPSLPIERNVERNDSGQPSGGSGNAGCYNWWLAARDEGIVEANVKRDPNAREPYKWWISAAAKDSVDATVKRDPNTARPYKWWISDADKRPHDAPVKRDSNAGGPYHWWISAASKETPAEKA